jgi:GNAT superfamily N-acetyltransferase
MHVREAQYEDRTAIAAIHAESWRGAFRGLYRDEYLDGEVVADRMQVWERRMSEPAPNQFVVLVEDETGLAGFACAYGRDDEHWGTLLDNLHVRREGQRRGIGTRLVSEVAAWCRAHYADCGLYLWVLTENVRARRFYESLGAADREGDVVTPPGGGRLHCRRYAWKTVQEISPTR